MHWFDAHLDLAYLAECGRDMHADLDDCRGRYLPAAVTLPSLRDGGVRACLATIFTEAIPDPNAPDAESGAFAYPLGDAERAYVCGMRQLKLYQAWAAGNAIDPMPMRGDARSRELPRAGGAIVAGVLMECADPIRTPDELDAWADAGVVAIGMAWWRGSRYAAGNGADPNDAGAGLTDMGRELAKRMDARGVVHDLSHLSPRATLQLLEATDAPVVASHSNCRALMAGQDARAAQRHLDDATIREIARRGGVVGINLLSDFLDPRIRQGQRSTIDKVCAHVEHVCEIAGSRAHVGLGSDMDGGFTADRLPVGIDTPSDLDRIADALRTRGWSDADVRGFAYDNWARFWGLSRKL